MRKAIIILSIILGNVFAISAQGIKIGDVDSAPHPSALLEVESDDKGFLLPRMSETDKNNIVNPAIGLMVFQTTAPVGFYYYNGTNWQQLDGSGSTSGFNEVINPSTGEIWMDRNLGASQVATSSTDTAAYGDLYQWGRGDDGHQLRTSSVTATLSTTDNPGHSNFISNTATNWRSPANDNLWQGVNGINNPCPLGFRIPSSAELDAEHLTWSSDDASGAFGSPLKLVVAGYRIYTGNISNTGSYGTYWSSTVSTNDKSSCMRFYNNTASIAQYFRSTGVSVRCIKG